jgi:hypothetical protein
MIMDLPACRRGARAGTADSGGASGASSGGRDSTYTRPAREPAATAAARARARRRRRADRGTPGRSGRACRRSHASASPCTTSRSARSFVRTRSAAPLRASRSTSTTRAAPREAASKPSAPLPAKRSRHASPSSSWPSQLKSVSRTRSGVGRRPGASTTASGVRFQRRRRCVRRPMMRGRGARPGSAQGCPPGGRGSSLDPSPAPTTTVTSRSGWTASNASRTCATVTASMRSVERSR